MGTTSLNLIEALRADGWCEEAIRDVVSSPAEWRRGLVVARELRGALLIHDFGGPRPVEFDPDDPMTLETNADVISAYLGGL